MRVLGISWAGVVAEDFTDAVRFFNERMGLPIAYRSPDHDVVHFRFPNDDLFELFGPDTAHADLERGITIAFEVDDIEAARQEMEQAGVEFVTDIDTWEDEAWCYFAGPDDRLYELKQVGYESRN